jgi:hypothetical protein
MAVFVFDLPIPSRVFRCKNAESIPPNSDFTRFYSLAAGYKRLAPQLTTSIPVTALLPQQKTKFSKSVFLIRLFLIRE